MNPYKEIISEEINYFLNKIRLQGTIRINPEVSSSELCVHADYLEEVLVCKVQELTLDVIKKDTESLIENLAKLNDKVRELHEINNSKHERNQRLHDSIKSLEQGIKERDYLIEKLNTEIETMKQPKPYPFASIEFEHVPLMEVEARPDIIEIMQSDIDFLREVIVILTTGKA